MRVDEFDFELPPENIALRPASPRDAARLLVVNEPGGSALSDRRVCDLADLLQPGDVLVFNDTRVIPARLRGRRTDRGTTQPAIEVTLHQKLDDHRWRAFAKPGRKLKEGDTISFGTANSACMAGALGARVTQKLTGGEIGLAFDLSGPFLETAIAQLGEIPLPPYIASKRPCDARDLHDYQTIYADKAGAVAAPTAGLHFTPQLLDSLRARNVDSVYLTLHVGAGTFLPVKADDTCEHKMHAENGFLSREAADRLNTAKASGRRVIAVGTTALRLLESAADEKGVLRPFAQSTDIFITPGYRFRVVDALMTNFHLPRSTLFMLVSAFSGLRQMQDAYKHAIAQGYRFYSYGDSSLLFPDPR